MAKVDTRKPVMPPVKSAIKIESSAFTATLPSSRVHSSKLPLAGLEKK